MAFVVLLLPLVLAVALAALSHRAVARRSFQHDVARARRTLIAEQASAASAHVDPVIVEGILASDDDLDDPQAGRRNVAATRWASRHRFLLRAPVVLESEHEARLRIETGDGPVTIEGAVSVIAARSLWFGTPCTDLEPTHFEMRMSLRRGDPVVALGMLRRSSTAVEQAGHYRQQATATVLAPLAHLESVRLVTTTTRPSVALRLRAWFWSPVAVTLTLVGSVMTLYLSADFLMAREECTTSCTQHGACDLTLPLWTRGTYRPELVVTSGSARSWLHLFSTSGLLVCAATKDAHCARADDCKENGLCTARAGACVAAKDTDCAHAGSCFDAGRCTARSGQCALGADEDCRNSANCLTRGECVRVADSCAAVDLGPPPRATDAECRASQRCLEAGACSASPERMDAKPRRGLVIESTDVWCMAGNDEDCKGSVECIKSGACSLKGGRCVAASHADCRLSVACRDDRRCFAEEGRCEEGPSKPLKQCLQDLLVGPRCIDPGVHTLDGREWHRPPGRSGDSCSESQGCRLFGRCEGGPSQPCASVRRQDCEKSEWCKKHGACRPIGDACASSCADTLACREHGQCSASERGMCVAMGSDCRASQACKTLGLCTAFEGACRAAGDDCKQTVACLESGACTADEGVCKATVAEDCARSRLCLDHDYCYPRDGKCAAPSDAECRSHTACRVRGVCWAAGMGRGSSWRGCIAATVADCQASDVCKRYGWCSLVQDRDACFFGPRSTP